MPYARDPVSLLFDEGARRLLGRAYAHPGTWVTTRLAAPGPRITAWLAALGINPYGPDRPSIAAAPAVDARNRWTRGFVRAIYYQHKWHSGRGGRWRDRRRAAARSTGTLEVRVGRWLPVRGVIPAGREVRIRVARAARRPAGQAPHSDPARRDW